MSKRLSEYFQECDLQAIIRNEHRNPHQVLGAHLTEEGLLIAAYLPQAVSAVCVLHKTRKRIPMECIREGGIFALFLTEVKELLTYHFMATYMDQTVSEEEDPYAYEPVVDEAMLTAFSKGIGYQIYDFLGAHEMKIRRRSGTQFAVWAPNALNVNVVGDFNGWDGRRHQMKLIEPYGVFVLFIPEVLEGELYKYEIRIRGGITFMKADPYAVHAEKRPANASVVYNLDGYRWEDNDYLAKRDKKDMRDEPMSIYEVHLGSFKKPTEEDGSFYNYQEIAPMLADYVKEMGYTHIELLPVMEHPFDGSWGYQVTGYYAPTSRFGTPKDFMFFIDYMHRNNIGVILDWVPAHFPRDAFGLANFDGTCLYEHADPRLGTHPHWGTLIFNYGRPEVSNFLIANALYWVEKYHVDGIRFDAVASMLYLDYGKKDGEWVANRYGGHENLEAIELLKHLNSMMHKRNPSAMMIAEESTAWPMVSGNVEDGGLGFTFKWNMGWMNDFLGYMKLDPLFRKGDHNALTFGMMYAYSERFVLVFSHDEVVHGKGSMIQKMPGEYNDKFSNLRVAYGYLYSHPGKKLMFMGQEFAQYREWDEKKSLDWMLVDEYDKHRQMQNYVKALNHLYGAHPAFYESDYKDSGFSWINCHNDAQSMVSFVRASKQYKETLVIVCNFIPVTYDEYRIGVPKKGNYRELLNSDAIEFGGTGCINEQVLPSEQKEWDGREDSVTIKLPGLSFVVLSYVDTEEKDKPQKKRGKR